MIHEDLSRDIIGAAMVVLNELKPGLDEKLYERALIIELRHRSHNVLVQSSFPVSYRGELIGNLIPDLIRHACSADDRISKHHEPRPGPSHKFQECAIRMETCIASAGT